VLKQGEHEMFECLIYLISKTLHHHGILEATLEGECWNMSIIASEHYGFLIFRLSFSLGI